MSLAAALAGARPASFLPTVKCSDCGYEIEISEIGEHVCAPNHAPPAMPNMKRDAHHTPDSRNPFMLRSLNTPPAPLPSAPPPLQHHRDVNHIQNTPNGSSQSPARATPWIANRAATSKLPNTNFPTINSDAANLAFLSPGQRGLDSPLSPATSTRSGSSPNGKPSYGRSMTAPAPRLYDPRPPSPELSANLDCAFPPFPTASGRRPSTPSNGRKTPTGSERAPSRGGSRLDQVQNAEPVPSDLDPNDPRFNGGHSIMRKLSTLKSGPFTSRTRDNGDHADGNDGSRRPSESAADDFPSRSVSPGERAAMRDPPTRPARPTEEVVSPRFLEQLSSEPASLLPSPLHLAEPLEAERSNTFPRPTENERGDASGQTLSKMRSEPALHSAEERGPTTQNGPLLGVPQSRAPPPVRGLGGNAPRMDQRIRDAPPVPKTVQQYKQEGLHTPTDSASSITSTHSTPNSNSSHASPSGSVASSVDAFPPLRYSLANLDDDEPIRVAGLNIKSPLQPGLRAEQPTQRSPPRTMERSMSRREPSHDFNAGSMTPLESPMDPALHKMQKLPPHDRRPTPVRTQTAPGPVPRSNLPPPPLAPALPIPKRSEGINGSRPPRKESLASPSDLPRSQTPSPNPLQPHTEPRNTKPKPRRPTIAKPTCRGCHHPITGKSVKAADGRLTGRWHRDCFVCRSCAAPFTTADFYVINNEPYCEQHYHEANNSVCHGCRRGIEGQYLETSTSSSSIEKKFHPRCFTCSTCRAVLAQDYFEITGSVFCERHALAAMRAQARLAPGLLNASPDRRGLMAERRTTRLINPMMA